MMCFQCIKSESQLNFDDSMSYFKIIDNYFKNLQKPSEQCKLATDIKQYYKHQISIFQKKQTQETQSIDEDQSEVYIKNIYQQTLYQVIVNQKQNLVLYLINKINDNYDMLVNNCLEQYKEIISVLEVQIKIIILQSNCYKNDLSIIFIKAKSQKLNKKLYQYLMDLFINQLYITLNKIKNDEIINQIYINTFFVVKLIYSYKEKQNDQINCSKQQLLCLCRMIFDYFQQPKKLVKLTQQQTIKLEQFKTFFIQNISNSEDCNYIEKDITNDGELQLLSKQYLSKMQLDPNINELSIMMTYQEIIKVITQLAEKLNTHYQKIFKQNQNEQVEILILLTGAYFFVKELTQRLNFKYKINFIQVCSFRDFTKHQVYLDKAFLTNIIDKPYVLILDELVDSGKTQESIWTLLPKANFCSLFVKTNTQLFQQIEKIKKQRKVEFFYGINYIPMNFYLIGFGLDDYGEKRGYCHLFYKNNLPYFKNNNHINDLNKFRFNLYKQLKYNQIITTQHSQSDVSEE